jgi:2-polyprenyl-3-methyl-5-hydroxy-6-metoxy-1,4-benzoquinol methylase
MLFECILAVDVLERTPDPNTCLRRIHTMLHPDGHGLLIVHNAASRSGVMYDLSHLTYFTEGTLSRMLAKCHLRADRMDLRGETSSAGDERICCIIRKK